MSDITDYSPLLSDSLTQESAQLWQEWLSARDTASEALDSELCRNLFRALCLSPFVADSLNKITPDMESIWPLRYLADDFDWKQLESKLTDELQSLSSDLLVKKTLRQWRRYLMTLVAIRNLSGLTSIEQDYSDISNIADLFLRCCYNWLFPQMCEQWGTPLTADGESQNLLVVAMGKYGGRELNFSSDIDLIFYYLEDGTTQAGARSLEHQTFFIRLGQRMISLLGDLTADGLVYRIDMRLRPYGEGGPLAMSFPAAEDYYQEQGREWERFAMVKARVVIGSESEKAAFYRLVRPFVFRRYIDFGVLEAIREIKVLISSEVKRKQIEDNIKLGRGGIREAEFIVQALQLIRGGRVTDLQHRGFMTALESLRDQQLLPEPVCKSLRESYLFLRRTEHVLQQMQDQQTQNLPVSADEQERLAAALNFDDYLSFLDALQDHQNIIHQEFDALFAQSSSHGESAEGIEKIRLEQLHDITIRSWLENLNKKQIRQVETLLNSFVESSTFQQLSEKGKHRLSVLLPQLLTLLNQVENPDVAFSRIIDLVRAISKRTAYLVLLAENPPILEQLVKLSSQSRWISERLAQFPVLLDELLYPSSLYNPLETSDLQQELRRQLLRIEPEDEEQQQEQLRVFKQTNELRVASACINDVIDIRKSSRLLSAIAESIIGSVMQIAWKNMCRRHGVPNIAGASYDCLHGFAVVAYGKLGGEELGFGSDLDLVFLYQADPESYTSGSKSISHSQFFTRLAQRMIHMLNIRTMSGVLYEVDTRLRPSGNSGLLVSHNLAFADYQKNEAWTWEHQALIRARGICGDPELVSWFEQLRLEVLGSVTDQEKLKTDVLEMRDKMKANLDKSANDWMDIKQGRGGIVDIEFLVQYLVLKEASQNKAVNWSSRTTLLLQQLEDIDAISNSSVKVLVGAYRYYRKQNNRLVLRGEKKLLPVITPELPRQDVARIWQEIFA